MKLSKHFSLSEFLRSQTASRLGIDMTPGKYELDNLATLCINYLEPLREELGNPIIHISSGFRPLKLNNRIGGSATSAHLIGCAADIVVTGIKPLKVARVLKDSGILYDQNIHEFGAWVHIGFSVDSKPRLQDLTAYRKDGKVLYIFGLHKIKDLTK